VDTERQYLLPRHELATCFKLNTMKRYTTLFKKVQDMILLSKRMTA